MSIEEKSKVDSAVDAAASVATAGDLTEAQMDYLLALPDSELTEFLSSLGKKEAKALTKTLQDWNKTEVHKDPRKFRSQLLIDVDGKLCLMTSVMEPWQREDFITSDASWNSIIHGETLPKPKFLWRERARGHSKTTDVATQILCAIYSAPRKLSGVASAGSKDQARIVRDACDTLVRDNPWLAKMVEVQNYVIKNKTTGSLCEVISSDESTSYGKVVNFVICDELTHWKSRDLWNSLFSTADKKKNCILVVLTNAGVGQGTSWTWEVRESARKSGDWHFSCLDGPQASWVTPEVLARQEQFLSPNAFTRLWKNLWIRDTGTGISMDDVDQSMSCHTGPIITPEPGVHACFIASLDFGIRHDNAALIILGINLRRRKIRLALVKSWKPRDFAEGKISPHFVQNETWEILKRFRCSGLVFDTWGFEGCAEWIESQYDQKLQYSCPTYPSENTPLNLSVMAVTLVTMLRNQDLEMYPDKELRADFTKMSIKETNLGTRLEALRDDDLGHCDRGMALAIGLPFADSTMRDYLDID